MAAPLGGVGRCERRKHSTEMAIRQVARRDGDGQWLVEMVIEKLHVETVELRIPQLPVLRPGGAPGFQTALTCERRQRSTEMVIR